MPVFLVPDQSQDRWHHLLMKLTSFGAFNSGESPEGYLLETLRKVLPAATLTARITAFLAEF